MAGPALTGTAPVPDRPRSKPQSGPRALRRLRPPLLDRPAFRPHPLDEGALGALGGAGVEGRGRALSAQEEASAGGTEPPACRLCKQPVVKNREMYEVFEGMHWIRFHVVFEHVDADPDAPCEDPSCPWVRLEVLGEELRRLGVDPDELPRLDFLG